MTSARPAEIKFSTQRASCQRSYLYFGVLQLAYLSCKCELAWLKRRYLAQNCCAVSARWLLYVGYGQWLDHGIDGIDGRGIPYWAPPHPQIMATSKAKATAELLLKNAVVHNASARHSATVSKRCQVATPLNRTHDMVDDRWAVGSPVTPSDFVTIFSLLQVIFLHGLGDTG